MYANVFVCLAHLLCGQTLNAQFQQLTKLLSGAAVMLLSSWLISARQQAIARPAFLLRDGKGNFMRSEAPYNGSRTASTRPGPRQ